MNLATGNDFRAYSLKNGKTGPNGEKYVVIRPSGFADRYFNEAAAAANHASRMNEKER